MMRYCKTCNSWMEKLRPCVTAAHSVLWEKGYKSPRKGSYSTSGYFN